MDTSILGSSSSALMNNPNGLEEVNATGVVDHAQVRALLHSSTPQRLLYSTSSLGLNQIETHDNIAEVWTTLKLTWVGKSLELEIAESDR